MIRFKAEVAGQQHELQFRRQDRTLNAAIDERQYEIDVHDLGAGQYLLRQGVQVYDCHVETTSEHPDSLS